MSVPQTLDSRLWNETKANWFAVAVLTFIAIPATVSGMFQSPANSPRQHGPLDLQPAVEDTKRVFAEFGLPENWYKSLNGDPQEFNSRFPLYMTAIWAMVDDKVETSFQKRFRTKWAPFSKVEYGTISSTSPVFEEVLLLSMIGHDHMHVSTTKSASPMVFELPNIDPRFVRGDGSVNFEAIFADFKVVFDKQEQSFVAERSTASNDEEVCMTIGEWEQPGDNPPDWLRKQVAWRVIVRVEFVEGTRTLPIGNVAGDRRLVLSTYLQIGYRKSDEKEFSAIHLAGPFNETAYRPIGKGQVDFTPVVVKKEVSPCPGTVFEHKDLGWLTQPLADRSRRRAPQRILRSNRSVAIRGSRSFMKRFTK